MWLRHVTLSKTANLTFFGRPVLVRKWLAKSQNDLNGMFPKKITKMTSPKAGRPGQMMMLNYT